MTVSRIKSLRMVLYTLIRIPCFMYCVCMYRSETINVCICICDYNIQFNLLICFIFTALYMCICQICVDQIINKTVDMRMNTFEI